MKTRERERERERGFDLVPLYIKCERLALTEERRRQTVVVVVLLLLIIFSILSDPFHLLDN